MLAGTIAKATYSGRRNPMSKLTYDELLRELATTKIERDEFASRWLRAVQRREHTHYWWGVRSESLRELLDGTEYWDRFINIVANGTPCISTPPTYAQQLNTMRWQRDRNDKQLIEFKELHQGLMERFPDHDASAPLENFLVEIDCLKSAFRQLGDLMISQCKESTGE